MSKIPITIDVSEIGEFEVLLTEKQVKQAIIDGKEIFKLEDEELTDTSDYIYGMGATTKKTSGGFTENTIDWNSLFPNISLKDIKDLSDKAVEQEKETYEASRRACVLITMALSSYMNK